LCISTCIQFREKGFETILPHPTDMTFPFAWLMGSQPSHLDIYGVEWHIHFRLFFCVSWLSGLDKKNRLCGDYFKKTKMLVFHNTSKLAFFPSNVLSHGIHEYFCLYINIHNCSSIIKIKIILKITTWSYVKFVWSTKQACTRPPNDYSCIVWVQSN